MRKLNLILISLMVISNYSYPQEIIRIHKNYALINTDQNLGEIGDVLKVYRKVEGTTIYIGELSILQFQNGMTACKIISGDPLVHDFIATEPNKIFYDLSSSYSASKENQKTILDIGFMIGTFIPLADMANVIVPSFTIGCFLFIPLENNNGLVVEFNFPFLKHNTEYDDNIDEYYNELKSSLFHIIMYPRLALDPTFFFDIGIGLYFPQVSISRHGLLGIFDETYFGFCLGPSIQLKNNKSFAILISGKYQTYNSGGDWRHFLKADLQLAIKLNK